VGDGSERRRSPRLSTAGETYGVSFHREGQIDPQARLTNISATGCALELPMSLARTLELGSILRVFYLDHPDLPFVPLEATVVRLLGKVPGKTSGYVLAGADFTLITPLVQGLIEHHVDLRLGNSEA